MRINLLGLFSSALVASVFVGACATAHELTGGISDGGGATGPETGTMDATQTSTSDDGATSIETRPGNANAVSDMGTNDTDSDGSTLDASVGEAQEGGTPAATRSAGCGMALPTNVILGGWTDMADPGNGNPPPIKAGNVNRGYWVYVPANYDKNKPYKVIYQGAGCGVPYPNGNGQSNKSGMGTYQPVWPFQNVDMGEAIQVGIDYGYSIPNCYDDHNPQSNDFTFFPILKTMIESTFCIDGSHVYLSGHSSGSWWTNQMTCAFGNEIRGIAVSTGGEPPQQPACVVGAHIASLFLHDINDQLNSYQGILPACARALKNNGCATTTCDPSNAATTTSWPIPQGLTIPGKGQCVQFNGCPANSPVVFCTTTNADPGGQNHYEFVNSFIAPLFWHLLSQF
jgi:poly(3-hydroxybutyrate) depolymerase